MKLIKILLITLICAIIAVTSAGCGAGDKPTPPSNPKFTIDMTSSDFWLRSISVEEPGQTVLIKNPTSELHTSITGTELTVFIEGDLPDYAKVYVGGAYNNVIVTGDVSLTAHITIEGDKVSLDYYGDLSESSISARPDQLVINEH